MILLTSHKRERQEIFRFLGIAVAVALLNLGFYFILWVFAALVAGAVGGFFILKPRLGALTGFVGSICVYMPLLVFLECIEPTGADVLSVIGASVILSLLGGLGGLLGGEFGGRFSPRPRIG